MKPTSLDDNIIYQCSQFSHRFTQVLNAGFRAQGLDLTPEQLSILVALLYKGKATQQEISIQLGRDKTTVTRVIRHLETKGLIHFAPHPTDNRSRLAALTPKGERLQNSAIQVSGALYMRTLEGIPQTDLRVALRVLGRMTRNCLLIFSFMLTATLPLQAQKNPALARKYRIGDSYRYRLTCKQYSNGEWKSTNISVCRLTVVRDSTGNPNDEITWESLRTIQPKDSLDHSTIARSVPPYRVSLTPKGPMALPPLTVPDMTESITDFNTFLVAIHPYSGLDSLQHPGDSFPTPKPAIGNFADGRSILKGEDCLAVTIKLTALNSNTADLQTSFLPPAVNGLRYILPEIDTPVAAGSPNNFQMVMSTGPKLYLLQYGREYFVIHSTISTKDGKLQKADMYNQLSLKLKLSCNEQYQHCQYETPLSIERRLTVELLPEKVVN